MTALELGFSQQRGERGFSDEDAWSLDSYLSHVIAGGVRRIATAKDDAPIGCPPELAVPDVEVGVQEWKKILLHIAEGFEEYSASCFTFEPTPSTFDEAFDLFRYWFRDLWD